MLGSWKGAKHPRLCTVASGRVVRKDSRMVLVWCRNASKNTSARAAAYTAGAVRCNWQDIDVPTVGAGVS